MPSVSAARLPAPQSSRSFLSRFASPFAKTTRNFTEFYIECEDPHRQYSPGDVISGSVFLKVIKPIRITHLVLSLHGYAQVYKNPNTPGDGYLTHNPTLGTGKGKRQGGYFGNGYVSLFEDEKVLCGEGRLAEGIYEFKFELQFPSKSLPSSIDFERGTVSYMLTSTLTRPTTMSPATTCDRKVYLIDNIDIAPIHEPKPRMISLEPVSRRPRTRRKRTNPKPEASTDGDSGEQPRLSRVSELSGSNADESEVPRSPAPSDISFGSHLSSSGAGSVDENMTMSVRTEVSGKDSKKSFSRPEKVITATIELKKAGFLRGDNIPLRISVQHTKHIKTPHGIIVTLYRQARVDMHPALPLANTKSDKVKTEDYYPKSKTGLGGLSLSSAGSSHVYRKDLSQSFAPLIVDPRTLTTDVKAAVRVPDEAFPTIATVPGAMISFKYYVEVVVDLQGKISGLDRYFANSGMVSVPTGYGNEPGMGRAEDAGGSMLAAWGGNFIQTDHIRREKNVVCCIFEVIVGTKDSERKKGKKKQEPTPEETAASNNVHEIHVDQQHDGDYDYSQDDYYYSYGYPYDQNIDHHDHYYEPYQHNYQENYQNLPSHPPPHSHSTVPIPNPPDGSNLSEKDRVRLAEQRLLPSRPPEDGGPSSTSAAFTPSAPILDDEHHYAHPPPHPPPITENDASLLSTSPAATVRPPPSPSGAAPSSPSAPAYHDPIHRLNARGPSAPAQATDDKQELQRRRLEMERSAPPTDDPEDEAGGSGSPSAPPDAFGPSVPILTEDEREAFGFGTGCGSGQHHDTHTGAEGSALPKYER